MRSKLFAVVAVAGGLLLLAGPLLAHHSGSYDREHPITMTGTVTEFLYMNPHVRVRFDVKDENGVVSNWTLECGPPRGLFKAGWNKEALKPGDKITPAQAAKLAKLDFFVDATNHLK